MCIAMLPMHILLNSGSVESLLETFSCVSTEIMSNIISFFQKLIKGGFGIRAGGLENFSKINKRGGRLFGTREYAQFPRPTQSH